MMLVASRSKLADTRNEELIRKWLWFLPDTERKLNYS